MLWVCDSVLGSIGCDGQTEVNISTSNNSALVPLLKTLLLLLVQISSVKGMEEKPGAL